MSEARARLAEVLDTARTTHAPVFLTRHGRRVGVIAGIDQWYQNSSEGRASPASDQSAEVIAEIEEISRRAAGLITPGTPVLDDARAYYETREPRL